MLDIRCLKDCDIIHIGAGRFILVRSTHFINSTQSGGKMFGVQIGILNMNKCFCGTFSFFKLTISPKNVQDLMC